MLPNGAGSGNSIGASPTSAAIELKVLSIHPDQRGHNTSTPADDATAKKSRTTGRSESDAGALGGRAVAAPPTIDPPLLHASTVTLCSRSMASACIPWLAFSATTRNGSPLLSAAARAYRHVCNAVLTDHQLSLLDRWYPKVGPIRLARSPLRMCSARYDRSAGRPRSARGRISKHAARTAASIALFWRQGGGQM